MTMSRWTALVGLSLCLSTGCHLGERLGAGAHARKTQLRRALLSWLMGFDDSASNPAAEWVSAAAVGDVRTTAARGGRFARSFERFGRVVGAHEIEVPVGDVEARVTRVGARALVVEKNSLSGEVRSLTAPMLRDGTGGSLRCWFAAALPMPVDASVAVRVSAEPIEGVGLPRSALIRRDERGEHDEVVVVRRRLPSGEFQLERRPVSVEPDAGDGALAVITHGITDGEQVVIANAQWIADGI
jgi:hypothetical protein